MFPLNSPSAIPETTTCPCLLPVPGKYEVECFFDHRIPSRVLDVSTVILNRNRRATRLDSVPGSVVEMLRVSERETKCLMSNFGWFSSFNVLNQKKPTLFNRPSFIVSEFNLWAVIFGRLARYLTAEVVDIDILLWCIYFFGPHTEQYRSSLYALYLHGLPGDDSRRSVSPVGFVYCWVGETLQLPVLM